MKLISSAFVEGRDIPEQYTCTGQDISPPLTWEQPPQETVSFVILCENPTDPEGHWVHWLVYNLAGDIHSLSAGEALFLEQLGYNSWDRQSYNGPCPKKTHTHDTKHRYYFRIYALDTLLSFSHFARPPYKEEVITAMKGHELATSSLFCHFHRRREGFDWPHPSKNLPGRCH